MIVPSMNAVSRARLATACRRYLAARPWRLADDNYPFGLHDRTGGQFGCASVLGVAGEEYGLSVLLGPTGFALLRRFLDGELDHSTIRAQASGVSFKISEAAPASRAFERLRPFVLDSAKVRVEDRRGYLTARRFVAGQPPRALDSEEGLFLARCLETVAALAESGRLGRESPHEDDRVLFYNVTDSVDHAPAIRRSYRRLADVEVQPRPVVLSPAQLARLRARPRGEGRYLVSVFTPAAEVDGGLLWTSLIADERGRPLVVEGFTTFDDAAHAVFAAFDGETRSRGGDRRTLTVPREVWTDSFPVYQATKDALAELDVRVVCDEGLLELAALRAHLDEFLAGPAEA